MKVITRLFFIDEQNEKFFGEGPYRLLKQVEQTGSLHSAAAELGMAYSKATKLLKQAEKSLGFSLTVRKIGGKSGGGSVLTEEAKVFLKQYEDYRKDCLAYNEKQFEKYFGKTDSLETSVGCVIMASGLGKRFGGNKLMADFLGKPMMQYVLEVTEEIFSHRVVVTRNEEVKRWCEEQGIVTVFHDLPGRNDTVRLGLEELESICEEELDGCIFCPADMPFMNTASLRAMLLAAKGKTEGIVRMSSGEMVGSPVLFGEAYFDELTHLPEGKGGSEIIRKNKDKLILVEAKAEYELWDVDTKEDHEKAIQKMISLM